MDDLGIRRAASLGALMAALSLTTLACDVTGVEGSGQSVAQTRAVEPFTEVEVRGRIQLTVTVGADPAVSISADDNLQPLVATRVEGGRLVIHPTTTLRPKTPVAATVNIPRLDKVIARSAAQATVTGLAGGAVAVEANGATTVALRGKVDSLSADLGGAARLSAQTLSADTVTVRGTGAAQAEVAAQQTLSADLQGACRVMFAGNPTVDKKVVEAAAITRGAMPAGGRPRGPAPLPPGVEPPPGD